MRHSPALAALLIVLACASANAQVGIHLRTEPQAEQTLHVTTTQDFSIVMNGGAASGAPGGMQIVNHSVLGFRQTNGRFDDNGRLHAQLTIDRIESDQTINGSSKPQARVAELVGRSLTAVFDRAGKLVDVQVPSESQQAAAMLKQLVAGAYGVWNFVPTAPMAVGETTTVTADIPLRLPGASARAPYQTRTTTTLRAIEHRGASRIARLEQRTEPAAPSDQLQVNGSGTIDIDVVRGIVTASAIEWRLAGPLAGIGVENTPGAHGTTPVVATIKVTLASE